MGGHASKARMTEIFEALDEDKNGSISVDEVHQWIQDEQFLDNEEFKGNTVSDLARALFKEMDTNVDGKISKEELLRYFGKLKEDQVDSLTLSMTKMSKDQREAVLRKVFNALDADHSGAVTKDEVIEWMKNERYWTGEHKESAMEDSREIMWQNIDRNSDSKIEFPEFAAYFSKWSIRKLRHSTTALLESLRLANERKENEKAARDLVASHQQSHQRSASEMPQLGSISRPEVLNSLPIMRSPTHAVEAPAPSTSSSSSSSSSTSAPAAPPPPPLLSARTH